MQVFKHIVGMELTVNLSYPDPGLDRGRLVRLPILRTSPEMDLLLVCLSNPLSPETCEIIANHASAVIDWEFFVALVARHRVFALAEHGLRAAGVMPPSTQAAALRAYATKTSWGELTLASELRSLQTSLHAAGLRPLVLKGVALAMKAYGRLGLRFNRDIDLLVDQRAVPATCEVLQTRGYQRVEPAADASPATVRRWLRRQKDIVYQHPANGQIVEVHWRLFDNPHLMNFDESGSRERIVIAGDFEIETLPADLHLIYACVHGAHHAWSRLKWLADICAVFGRMPPGEIENIYRIARTYGLHRPVAQGLLLCSRLLRLPIPAAVVADARAEWRLRWLDNVAQRSILSGGAAEIENLVLGSTPKNIAHYLIADGASYRLSEALFDLTDLSKLSNAPVALVPFFRLYFWLSRQAGLYVSKLRRPKIKIR